MAHDRSVQRPPMREHPGLIVPTEYDEVVSTPSLPIILVSVFVGLGCGALGLYVAYEILRFMVPFSVAFATLAMLAGLSIASGGLSALAGEGSGWINFGFSCGLTLLIMLYLGFCMLVGVLAATLMVI